MQKKAFTLINKGMNRDLSISKAGESSAYTNKNIRIIARDHDTLLSVTNERGTSEISLGTGINISGNLIGWSTLNNHIILFTTTTTVSAAGVVAQGTDYIYRVDYNPGASREFRLVLGNGDAYDTYLFSGNLGFRPNHPIEAITYYETESIQKVYWVDGINVLRMLNFMADSTERAYWSDGTYFDSNRWVNTSLCVSIEKDNAGNSRPNGVIQYLVTYVNKFGQETGYAWMSDIVYLSPSGVGGGADSTNLNRIILTIGKDSPTETERVAQPDDRYTHLRVYSIFRSVYDGQIISYLVGQYNIDKYESSGVHYGKKIVVIDDGSHLTSVDPSSILFLGSRNLYPGTMAQKDNTLFLGNLETNGASLPGVKDAIKAHMFANGSGTQMPFSDGVTWQAYCVQFMYSTDGAEYSMHIPYVENNGTYPYNNQLEYTSSVISTFKGGEKYRFGLMFRMDNGVNSEIYWIGDKVNGDKYPITVPDSKKIKRAIVKCRIPYQVIDAVKALAPKIKVTSVQLMVAEASYADRSIKAQGIINPTVFNVWDRYNDNLYSIPSWISRPRHSGYAWQHFTPIHNATSSTGEIECNYWETELEPTPYYRMQNYYTESAKYLDTFEGMPADENDFLMVVYGLQCYRGDWGQIKYVARAYVVKAKLLDSTNSTYVSHLQSFNFASHEDLFPILSVIKKKTYYDTEHTNSEYTIEVLGSWALYGKGKGDNCLKSTYNSLVTWIEETGGVSPEYIFSYDIFYSALGKYCREHRGKTYYWNFKVPNTPYTSPGAAAGTGSGQWQDIRNEAKTQGGNYIPSFYRKHLMFVDENVVTLDSPEIFYEAVSLDHADELKLRIIGVAKISGCISDDIVEGTQGMLPGQNHIKENFSGFGSEGYLDGIQTWPLWEEYGLVEKPNDEDEGFEVPQEVKERTSAHYTKGVGTVRYWMHMWNHIGLIDNYTDEDVTVFDGDAYSRLRKKAFANLKFSYSTIFTTNGGWSSDSLDDIRIFNYTSSQYVGLKINDRTRYYDAVINTTLTPPGDIKYPISFSTGAPIVGEEIEPDGSFLFSGGAIPITYSSSPHVVIALPSVIDPEHPDYYTQTILPYISNFESALTVPVRETVSESGTTNRYSGSLISWIESSNVTPKNYIYGNNPPTGWKYYSATGILSLVSNSDLRETDWYKKTWKPGVKYFGEEPVYVRLRYTYVTKSGTTPGDFKYMFVDISRFKVSDDGLRIDVDHPDFKNYNPGAITPSVENLVVVNYAEFNSATATAPSSEQIGTLQLETGTFTAYDVSTMYPYVDYAVNQEAFTMTVPGGSETVYEGDRYLFVGEIYQDFDSDPTTDTRYGGITLSAVANNRFVCAGPQFNIDSMSSQDAAHEYLNDIYGDQGDTFFQRFDALRTKPLGGDFENNVIDITSAMLETHINIDGRTDLQRGLRHIASLDTEKFDSLNKVYSQPNNFIVGRDLEDNTDDDTYRSSITWTLEKHDAAETDEWMHITLASSLKLDGDKGPCNALRRYQNRIIAFQDRCLSEILFNSRVQVNASDGIPIEIANSGKVDGKQVITSNSGCTNKWSIVEGKQALYYVDNINKAFCAFNGQVANLSEKLGFTAWFKEHNKMASWTPAASFPNFVSYYDRIHSDVYLVGGWDTNEPCLVYNEMLGVFTSFFDYANVPMMVNVDDEFVSFYKGAAANGKLYRQNRGKYNNFFGTYKPFSAMYRITPDPFGDKIWSNIEYRADFYDVNPTGSGSGSGEILEEGLIDGGVGTYKKDTTFDALKVWNEYQTTGNFTGTASLFNDGRLQKMFRIWRCQIPRAYGSTYGLDRIRNPWVNIEFKKNVPGTGQDQYGEELMQLHDATIIYYE